MLLCYAAWVLLYETTAWIGAVRGPAVNVELSLDRTIPFIPWFQLPYLLCYVSPLGLFVVSRNPSFLKPAYKTFITMNLIAFAVFALLPVQGPPRAGLQLDSGSWINVILRTIYTVDTRYNAFPSLHVANPCLVALLAFRFGCAPAKRWTLAALALLISISTLFVHQHYILDMLGGMGLAWGMAGRFPMEGSRTGGE
jgi:membrane-associated phospholipid phosphatase